MASKNSDPGSRRELSAFRRVVKRLASIEIAVVVILLLGALTAWGTFVEAAHNSTLAASKIVYHSVWMYSTLAVLSISLIAVMIDRWPWQEKHTGFVLAHIGILVLLAGSLITKYQGVDGSVVLQYGKPERRLTSSETDFTVYASLDGASYRKLYDREVDFFSHPPTREKPYEVELPEEKVRVVEYLPYAYRDEKIVESKSENAGSAVRFQLQNDRVNMTDWLIQPGLQKDVEKNLGPARVVLAAGEYKNTEGKNVLVLRPQGAKLQYEIHTARMPNQIKKGTIEPGGQIETGWMGIVLRVLKYMPRAENVVSFQKAERQTELTTAAVKVDFLNREQWLSLNSMVKLFTNEAVYVVLYANRRLDLGFDIELQKFNVGRYPGTIKAASYESVVNVPGLTNHVISMNEPLKYNGFTLYQSSFSTNPETGQPEASVLSVNRDPGRWIKYLGSFLIVLGTIHLFWFKRRASRRETKAA